eukprot:Blabericola_migrator_1__7201@NODE_3654_length_1600_cov_12_786693_g2264_i0_p1_GENE_NODE_3654_length_1600_cov_12_786693_g2264_i0NODE_3654_length_1600_cov_12_786693_g2264_i0_p1_ORF_typecomplete_len103_score11_76_NODE_3654_length_1600_cov_12_786693_g2264_i0389697
MNVKENDTRRIEYKGRNKGVPARAWRKCGWEGDCRTVLRSKPTTAPDSQTQQHSTQGNTQTPQRSTTTGDEDGSTTLRTASASPTQGLPSVSPLTVITTCNM